jgi:hypothetical protein
VAKGIAGEFRLLDGIVTFNVRDFGTALARRGIELLTPANASLPT